MATGRVGFATTVLAWCVLAAGVFSGAAGTVLAGEEGGILRFLPAFIRPPQGAAFELVVSASGAGSACEPARPCSLATAMEKIRALNRGPGLAGDMTIALRGGDYFLASPLLLTAADSGSNGHVVTYTAYRGERPVLHGGFPVRGWVLHDPGKGIYRARVPAWARFRQLYVNNARAVRARGMEDAAFSRTGYGFAGDGERLAGLGAVDGLEAVGFNAWRSFRCPVAAVSGGSIYLENPCWSNAAGSVQPGGGFTSMAWLENSYHLLDREGEWYLDTAGDWLYYRPRSGEDPDSMRVVAPRAESLLQGRGTPDAPVSGIRFTGLTFAYANWTAPSGPDGYADLQAGFHFTGTGARLTRTPAAVDFTGARNVVFQGNVFQHLGGAGLSVARGSQQVQIIGNRFEDTSSTAIQAGDIDDADAPSAWMNRSMLIADNVIVSPGADYHDGVGIFAGYVSDTRIEHNELRDLPYSGISLGWGWGVGSYAGNNRVRANWIEHSMHTLQDGGAIYTLGPQPGSAISGNYVCMQSGTNGAIYPDQGSSGFSIHDNVLSHVGHTWLYLWYPDITGNHAWNNFTDNASFRDDGSGNVIEGTTLVRAGRWPAEAAALMNGAGPRSGAGSGRPSFCRQPADLLLVEDDMEPDESGSRWALAEALHAAGTPFANWDTAGGWQEPAAADLQPFATIVWDAGQGDLWESGPGDGAALTAWLDSGGRTLFMTSSTYHQQLFPGALLREYFNMGTGTSWLDTPWMESTGWLGPGGFPLADGPGTTALSGGAGTETILRSGGQPLGLSHDAQGYRTIYWALPFDLIRSAGDRASLMGRVLAW